MSHWIGNLQETCFEGTNNIRINYCTMVQQCKSPAIIIVNGRTEGYLKYQSLANTFYRAGYSVYMIDHRGQGLSQRELSNDHKGHVDKFEYYIDDLATFIQGVVQPQAHSEHILLGHSMGGAICTRYLQTKPHAIDKVILASPMHGILLPAPKFIIEGISKVADKIQRAIKQESGFVLGGGEYQAVAFERNELTQDPVQYEQIMCFYEDNPSAKLGSPTYHWLLEAFKACRLCIENAHTINVPILLLQAGADTIVDNNAQNKFIANMSVELIKPISIAQARHELFFEQSQFKDQALSAVENFLNIKF